MVQTRRLAAILAADVAGYSRLMGADEEGTLERLKALRRELFDPKISRVPPFITLLSRDARGFRSAAPSSSKSTVNELRRARSLGSAVVALW